MSKKTFSKMMVFAVIIVFLGALTVSFSTVSASDMGMHIVSPSRGAVISEQSFSVSGTFDTMQTNSFKLIIKLACNSTELTHIYPFSVANSLTWGPVLVNAEDFNNLPTKNLCDVTLQVTTAMPTIPPLQSGRVLIKWGVGNTTSTVPPSPPQNLKVSADNTNKSITLTWTTSTQGTYPIAGYAIYRGIEKGKEDFTNPFSQVGANTTSYTDKDVETGKAYYYIVKAYDNQNPPDYSASSNEVKGVLKDITPPDIIVNSPKDNTVAQTDFVTISGKITDEGSGVKKATVDSSAVSLSPDGSFNTSVNLTEGANTIVISALDKAGNKATKSLTITYHKKVSEVVINLQIGNPLMIVNGKTKEIDPGRGTKPVIIPKWSRTVVPIRAIVEALGGTIGWNGSERKVTIQFNGTTIELWIDNPKARVNGITKWIDEKNHSVKPIIINDRTMLPLRFVAESLGCKVDWYPETKAITIIYGG